MHKLINYHETPDRVTYSIRYTFSDGEQHVSHHEFTDKEAAMRYYAGHVNNFLKFRLDDFKAAVELVKKYYFDRTQVPYMMFDGGFRDAYYTFRYRVLPRIEGNGLASDSQTARMINDAMTLMRMLVPSLDAIGRQEIAAMLDDLQHAAGSVILVAKALHEKTYTLKTKTA